MNSIKADIYSRSTDQPNKWIPVINQWSPAIDVTLTEDYARKLLQIGSIFIYIHGTDILLTGRNWYDYFPGKGGGGGRLPIVTEKTITENGVYMAVDDHADGYNKVTVNTPVAPPPPVLIEKTVTENGTYLPVDDDADGYSKVTVEIPVGEKTVKFYDYDGSVIASYTPEQFAGLTSLPANPSHEGLTAQGWNYNLADAKKYVAKNNCLDIGQTYVTDDGKTRIYITLTEGRISPILQLYLNANSELDIDWGDGGAHSTFTSTSAGYKSERHNYSTPGDYVIAITVTTGSFILQSSSSNVSSILWDGNNNTNSPDRAYNNSIKKIEIGTGISSIDTHAFYYCYSLTYITIPNGVTSIGEYAFRYCFSLASITFPTSVTTISNTAFRDCSSLQSVIIPNSITSIGSYAFQYCYALTSITIPDSVTNIDSNAFQYCYSLTSITIPDSVTSIGSNAFQYCYALASIIIPNSVTSISSSVFYNCYSLQSITISDSVTNIEGYTFYNCFSLQSITIPDGVAIISQSAFYYCYSLQSITIPDTVTRINNNAFQNCWSLQSITIPNGVTSIGSNAFYYCYSLTSVTIPDSVTSIGSYAFQLCCGLGSIKFTSTTPPTVLSGNAWYNIPTSCIIYVPTGTLNAYKAATNYPSPSTYTYIEY